MGWTRRDAVSVVPYVARSTLPTGRCRRPSRFACASPFPVLFCLLAVWLACFPILACAPVLLTHSLALSPDFLQARLLACFLCLALPACFSCLFASLHSLYTTAALLASVGSPTYLLKRSLSLNSPCSLAFSRRPTTSSDRRGSCTCSPRSLPPPTVRARGRCSASPLYRPRYAVFSFFRLVCHLGDGKQIKLD